MAVPHSYRLVVSDSRRLADSLPSWMASAQRGIGGCHVFFSAFGMLKDARRSCCQLFFWLRATAFCRHSNSPGEAGLSHMSDDRDEELIVPPCVLDLSTNGGLIWMGSDEVEGNLS